LLSEGPRAAWGLGRLIREWKTLDDVPEGDGRPVLLLPGLVNSDGSNFVMRRYLNRLGYRAEGWQLGRNLGVRAIGPEGERLMKRIAALHAETDARAIEISSSHLWVQMKPEVLRAVAQVLGGQSGSPAR
jgi:hypothetical protein